MPASPLASAAAAADDRASHCPADAAAAAAAAAGSPPPPEEWLRTARQGLDAPVSFERLVAILKEWREAEARGDADAARPLGRLGRSRETTVAYRAHRARVLSEWSTMSDYATVVILGWADPVLVPVSAPCDPTPAAAATTIKKAAGPLHPRERLPRDGLFTPNDFPYYFEDGAWHELLWAPEPLTEEEVEAALRLRLREEEGKDKEEGGLGEERGGVGPSAAAVAVKAVHWVNPVELKSVPALWHAHVVFFRRRRRCDESE